MSLADNLEKLNEKIARAAEKSGRQGRDVRLVAVTKKVPHARVREAFDCGQRDFAENYVQEAILKMSALSDLEINWHCIGALQSNKVKLIVNKFALIHSVDRESILTEIAARAQEPQEILIEVNMAEEKSKSGVEVDGLAALIELAQKLGRIRLRGLMFMPPLDLEKKAQLAYFARARKLRDTMSTQLSGPHKLSELSMGTSHDFEAAVSEGATLVRVGTAIFGERT
jgi:pyridoxal phosphate enzyme (YggS family)